MRWKSLWIGVSLVLAGASMWGVLHHSGRIAASAKTAAAVQASAAGKPSSDSPASGIPSQAGTSPDTAAPNTAAPDAAPSPAVSSQQSPLPANDTAASAASATAAEEGSLVPYRGPVEHIFFHPLLAYPERAFDGDSMAQGFDDWFVTVREFKAILDGLYKNQYMLIDIKSLYDGKGTGSELMLPEGKKPLILSVDDIDYYDYMIRNGTVKRLALDEQGRIGAISEDSNHREHFDYDNEIVPILDSFVREHPDFSFHGAKGMLNVTGYEGILGYRTQNLQAKNYDEVKREAIQVVDALKKDGWSFASHGWGHLDAAKITLERLKADTKRWKEEVEPLVGPTPVYVFPFGSSVVPGDPKFQALRDAGFRVFCSVGPEPYLKRTADYVLMDRRHIDGIALRGQVKRLAGLFDARAVLDPVRPKK